MRSSVKDGEENMQGEEDEEEGAQERETINKVGCMIGQGGGERGGKHPIRRIRDRRTCGRCFFTSVLTASIC